MKSRHSLSLLRSPGLFISMVGLMTVGAPLWSAPPPSDLVIENIPDLPADIRAATDPYWAVSGNSCMDWQPKTNAMLVSTLSESENKMRLLSAPMGDAKSSVLVQDKFGMGRFMPGLGDLIIYSADHNGDEDFQLYGLDPVTNKSQMLTDGDSDNTNVIFDHTGKRIAYRSIMPQAENDVIYVMNPRNRDSRHIIMAPDSDGWMLEDWTHDGSHILVDHLTYEGGNLWSIDANSGETKLLTQDAEKRKLYLMARYTPNDTGLYVIVFDFPRKHTIDFLPIAPGTIGKIPKGVDDANEMELSPDGTWLAYIRGEETTSTLHLFNTFTGDELPPINLPPALIGRLRWTDDSSELGFSYGSATEPYQAYSYKIATRELRQWTRTEVVNPPTAVKPQLVKINSFDGLEVSGYLYRPDPQKFPGKRPVIISIHGGPASQYIPDYLGPYNYYLDTLGVALLYPNVRGSTGFGPEFVSLDDGKKREDSVKDIGAFLDWIDTDPHLDSNRVGVQGGSYGGYMTLATLIHYGNRVRCGSDMMGFTDFVTLIKHSRQSWLYSARRELGDERYPEMNTFLEGISPLNHVADIHDPVMITAGKNDPRVPVSESEQMFKALKAQNDIVWYILGEDEGHGFRRQDDAQYQFAAEAYFFQTYLLPEKRLTPLGPAAPAIKPSTHANYSTAPD